MAPQLPTNRPDSFIRRFGQDNVVVLGAPAIGKTDLFEEREFCTVEDDLAAAVEIDAGESVVVDETARLIDEKHDALMAKPDWEEAFDAD